jgi:sugar phosphate isomerase/epimerase
LFVTASTSCIPDEPLADIFDHLADLEFTNTELVIGEQGTILPSQINERYKAIVHLRNSSRRIVPNSIFFDVEPEDAGYLEKFTEACRLAKDCKIVVMTVRSAPLGAFFNEEIDRLRELVKIGMYHGVVVGIATEAGRFTEDPKTVLSFCELVKGLGVTLDPSHYIYNLPKPKDFEPFLPYVYHVRLRDTTQKQFQTSIGQGIVEFNRLVVQLSKVNYNRALCVDIVPVPGVEQFRELRKMRLLLEALL